MIYLLNLNVVLKKKFNIDFVDPEVVLNYQPEVFTLNSSNSFSYS